MSLNKVHTRWIVTLGNQTKSSGSTSNIVDTASVIDNVDKLA